MIYHVIYPNYMYNKLKAVRHLSRGYGGENYKIFQFDKWAVNILLSDKLEEIQRVVSTLLQIKTGETCR